MSDSIEIHAADGAWQLAFDRAVTRLSSALGPSVRIEHIGSTAVAGLGAKPILDILLGVHDQREIPRVRQSLEALGFAPGASSASLEMSVFLRRAGGEGDPPINLHLILVDSRPWVDLLSFRDRLRADPGLARTYENLKRRLAAACDGDLDAYTAGKSAFVAEVLGGAP